MLHPHLTLNCRGRLVDLSSPVVMGVLNINQDSFYPGSRLSKPAEVLVRAEQMLHSGAVFLDVGGMSSRPGAQVIDEEEELRRVIPTIEAIHRSFPEALISVDTIRGRVAREAVAAGASLINDISAGRLDETLYPTLAELQVPYVLMHMLRRPETMQQDPAYEDVVLEVLDFLATELGRLRELGLKDIIIDPGFGFGKTVEHNYQLLRSLHAFKILGVPILAGISRKSMICKVLKVNPADALNGTSVLHLAALQQGAHILRAHDVGPAMEVIRLWQQLEKPENSDH